MKYSAATESFLRYLEAIDRSNETIKGYKKELKYLEQFLEGKYNCEVNVENITLVDLEDYMYYMKRNGKKVLLEAE